ncbi:MAG: CoA-binding protein [Actinomycetota bacterium]
MPLSVIERLDLPDPLIAVVGATDHPGKFGGTIYRNLKAKGYRVVPVNPLRTSVDGDLCYPRITDLAETPDIVNIVVPPVRTMRVVEQAAALDDVAVWIQPGAADAAVRSRVDELDVPSLIDACIMVEARVRG